MIRHSSQSGMKTSYDNEPWELMRRLPNKFIRDIGFVMACPPLLLHSEEFSTVAEFSNFEWTSVAKWLENLDSNTVEQWFTKGKSSTRLGDHFAKCVEFVLRHSPVFELQCLHCSQQVLQTPPASLGDVNLDLPSFSRDPAAEKYINKRMKRLLRRQKYGKRVVVNTIGEFDFLFRDTRDESVQHWEVSVKYLLYVGPWEEFGLETPTSAKWFRLSHPAVETPTSVRLSQPTGTEQSLDMFLGFFLGPHVGETLADRKRRLKRQMDLSANAAAKETLEVLIPGEAVVSPKALLLGYLFYEPELWKSLEAGCPETLENDLNRGHWRGWWMHVEDFQSFSTPRDKSNWYVVPKQEWLSPILFSDEEVSQGKLLNVEDLLVLAEQVAVEASQRDMPRMRRFMVAEMQRGLDSSWVEVSRGFLVESSWPDTRMYSPVGFR